MKARTIFKSVVITQSIKFILGCVLVYSIGADDVFTANSVDADHKGLAVFVSFDVINHRPNGVVNKDFFSKFNFFVHNVFSFYSDIIP